MAEGAGSDTAGGATDADRTHVLQHDGGIWLGRGQATLVPEGVRFRGTYEAERAGCVAAVVFAVLGLIFGGKFVFDDLGVDLSGRKPGATAVVIFVAIVLVPAWLGYAIFCRLLARRIDRTVPRERLQQGSTHPGGRYHFWIPAHDNEPRRGVLMWGESPADDTAVRTLWESVRGAPTPGTCEMDSLGVRRHLQDGTVEVAFWDKLSAVALMTTNDGPFGPDVFWALSNGDGTGCVIPDQSEIAPALLERLQQLPGFDNEALIRAMSSTEDARFELWSKP